MFRRARDGRRRRGSLLLVVITLTTGLVPLSAPPASASARIHIECDFHHRKADDPIVYPRKRGAAHLHLFFGNKSTDAFSTWASLRGAGTNCNHAADKAAYWMPAVKRNGSLVKAVAGHFYYRGVHQNLSAIKAFPPGLKIIAGNADATRKQSTDVIAWSCQGSSSTGQAQMRDCGAGGHVKVLIKFPSCWDGKRKDSKNHKAHMHYATRLGDGRRGCPRSHPVPVPELTMAVSFAMRNGDGVTLSSGKFWTMHADFFNAWNQTALKKMIRNCIHANKEC
jgi:Domain of unknown function (DUF1996)